jgi:hypothetical protein
MIAWRRWVLSAVMVSRARVVKNAWSRPGIWLAFSCAANAGEVERHDRREDSAFYGHGPVGAAVGTGAQVSVTVRLDPCQPGSCPRPGCMTLHLPNAWPWEDAWTTLFRGLCAPPPKAWSKGRPVILVRRPRRRVSGTGEAGEFPYVRAKLTLPSRSIRRVNKDELPSIAGTFVDNSLGTGDRV